MRLMNIFKGQFKHHYGDSSISLCNYEYMIETGPPISENQGKESRSGVVSPHLLYRVHKIKIKGIFVQSGVDCSLIKMCWMIVLMEFDQRRRLLEYVSNF